MAIAIVPVVPGIGRAAAKARGAAANDAAPYELNQLAEKFARKPIVRDGVDDRRPPVEKGKRR